MNHADHFLRRAHRRARGTLLAWSLALALFACALSLAQHLAWFPQSLGIGSWFLVLPGLPALGALVTLVLWARRARRLDALAHARDLDARLALSARLETAAELASDRSALAAAQRVDAATQLAARPAPATTGWLSGLVLLALVSLLLLSELAFLGFRALFRENPPAAPELTASANLSTLITWKSPESEIKALAIEEVPLEAHISTPTGLRSPTLEISVNGQPRLSRPLDAADLAPLARPGDHRLELSLYLDELAVKEFDLVSYHLRAHRNTPPSGSQLSALGSQPVASPLQFIQIRPPREDVLRAKAGQGTPLEKLSLLIGNLKAAQLQLMKQNFLLAHAPIDHATPAWREENTRVAADQNTLAQKTAEAREYAIAEGFPTLVVDNLGQARPLMASAVDKITAAQNPAATEPQGQALGLLTACEKLIQKIITEGGQPSGSPPPPKNNDPFKDKQVFKLPPRAETPAGQLEQLAQQQDAASQSLNGNQPAKKDPLAEQAELARKLGALAAPGVLSEAAQQKAAEAAKDAAEAAQQLKAGDTQAARAPAEAAAQALREAVAAQEAAGRATAQAELEAQRRAINEAERKPDSAARDAALAQAAQKLREEAAQQQQTGSAEAARQLAATAAAIDRQRAQDPAEPAPSGSKPAPGEGSSPAPSSPTGQTPEATPSSEKSTQPGKGQGTSPGSSSQPGKAPGSSSSSAPGTNGPGSSGLGQAASAAAQAQAALTPRDQALARASRQLNRAAQAPSAEAAAEAQLAAQFSTELLTDLAARDVALRLANTLSNTGGSAQDIVTRPDVRDAVTQLVLVLEAARHAGRRDEQIRRYNPDDLDPAYRPAVETYFEKLSRDAAKP